MTPAQADRIRRAAREAAAADPDTFEDLRDDLAALVGADLRRMRAGSRTPDSPNPRRAA